MFSRDNFTFSNQTYSDNYNTGLVTNPHSHTITSNNNNQNHQNNHHTLFDDQTQLNYSPPGLENSFITPPMNHLPYYDIPVSNVNQYMDWNSFSSVLPPPSPPQNSQPNNLNYLKPDHSPPTLELRPEPTHPTNLNQPQQDTNYFFPTIHNLTVDSTQSFPDQFSDSYSQKSITTNFFGSFPRLPSLHPHHQPTYAPLPPRSLGLPATTHLAPGVNVPRRKPTLLSRDPSQPILYCKFCLQPFSRRNSLRRHEQLHTGLKPYLCHPCGRSFSRQDIFKRHCASRRCMRLTQEETWNNSR